MINLREARAEGQLDQFIAEHEGETGDLDTFNATLASMVGTSKAVPEASKPDHSDD